MSGLEECSCVRGQKRHTCDKGKNCCVCCCVMWGVFLVEQDERVGRSGHEVICSFSQSVGSGTAGLTTLRCVKIVASFLSTSELQLLETSNNTLLVSSTSESGSRYTHTVASSTGAFFTISSIHRMDVMRWRVCVPED